MRAFSAILVVMVSILVSGCGSPTCSDIWQQREDLNAEYRSNSASWTNADYDEWHAKFKKLTDEIYAKDCSGPDG